MKLLSHGKLCAGNPLARFDEGASASEEPRRNAQLHNAVHVCTLVVFASLSLLTAAGSEEFPSVEKAMVGFSTNTVAAQERAYQYVLEKSRTMNGQNARTVLQALKTMAEALKRGAEFDDICLAGMASDDERMRFDCASALLQSPTLATNPTNLILGVEKTVRNAEMFLLPHRLELVRSVAGVRMQKLSDAKGALALIDEAIAWAGEDRPFVWQMCLRKMEILRDAKMDDALEKEARLILSNADCPSQPYQTASYALVDIAVRRKNAQAAGELLLDVIRKVDPVPMGIAKRLLDANVDEATLDAAVTLLRTRLAGMPLGDATAFRTAVEKVQPEIIELLNRLGRCDEALAECRVLVLLSSPKSYQAAVNLTAASLKRADGNLGRATAFMNFQKKGFVPKERNILLDAPQLSDGVRAEARKSLPVGKSEVWGESLAVSARLIWLDDPVAAVREAMRAFGLAPFDNKSLQICADAIMQPILTVTRNPDSAKGIVDYLMYGPNGPDGAKGTQDDLPSPFENLEPVLKLGHGN